LIEKSIIKPFAIFRANSRKQSGFMQVFYKFILFGFIVRWLEFRKNEIIYSNIRKQEAKQ